MLCASCRSAVSELHNFCFNCGVSLRIKGNRELSSSIILQSSSIDDEHQSSQTLSTESQAKRCKFQGEKEVTINVGQVILDNNYEFKKLKGKTKQIKVLPSSDKDQILERALKVHASQDEEFDPRCEYALLYPDFNEITTLPGTDEQFTLKDYKQESGKRWARITFLMAKTCDIERWAEKSDTESSATTGESSFEDAQCDVNNTRLPNRKPSVQEEQISTEETTSISGVDKSYMESSKAKSGRTSGHSVNGKSPILESIEDEISPLGDTCNVDALLVSGYDGKSISDGSS